MGAIHRVLPPSSLGQLWTQDLDKMISSEELVCVFHVCRCVCDTHVHVCVYCACVHGGMGRWCLHFIGNWRSTDFQEEKPEGTEGLTVV